MEETHHEPTFTDHHVPLQGESAMKNNGGGGGTSIQLEREMEKQKIREEIIASEIIRRQELEAEVRRELMIEKQLLGTSDDNLGDKMKLIGHPTDVSDALIEEEIAFGNRPFGRDLSYVAAQVSEKSEEVVADEVMAEITPSAGIIGMKRKAESSASACNEDVTLTIIKDSEKWFCSLCGVSTTSETTLNSHFQGRKHKAKEARSQASSGTGDNLTLHLQSGSTLSSEQEKNSLLTKKWECSLCQFCATSEMHLTSHLQGKKHKAKEAKLQTGEIISNIAVFPPEKSEEVSVPSSNANAIDADKQWYCSLCEVSASSEKNLNDHFDGKRHRAKAGLPQQGIINMNNESIEKVFEVEVTHDKSLDVGDSPKNEHKPDNATADASDMKSEELENVDEMSMEFVKYWHCKMCNMGTHDEATMAAHRKSDGHMTLLRENGGGLISVKTIHTEALETEGISREDPSA